MNGDLYYYKKKGVLIDRYIHSTEMDKYMKFSGTKLVKKLSFSKAFGGRETYCKYFKSDKRPDDSKIISKAKKLIGRTKKSKIAMGSLKKNTTVNRAKYL